MDNEVLETVFTIIDKYMDGKRPVFEVVRRCIELLDKTKAAKKKRKRLGEEDEERKDLEKPVKEESLVLSQ